MRIQLFLVVFVLTSTCSTVANADTCTNCKALVASLRDELISDSSIRQQQEVLVASLCPASSDPADCLETLPSLWRHIAMILWPGYYDTEMPLDLDYNCPEQCSDPKEEPYYCDTCQLAIQASMDQLLTEEFMNIVVDGLTGPWYCDTHPDDLDCPSKVNETIRDGLPILAEEMFAILDSGEVCNTAVADTCPANPPPPHDKYAKMARYITHFSNHGAMATISSREPTTSFPFANVFSMADGPLGESSGTIYMYTTPIEISFIDLAIDNRASITLSLAQGEYCDHQGLDPQDPPCGHICLTGRIERVVDPEEEEFAQRALFSRHPNMEYWPADHAFYFAKLNMTNIILLDWYGGAITVPLEEYYAAKVDHP